MLSSEKTLSVSVNKLEIKEAKLLNNVTSLEERARSADKHLSDARRDLDTLDKIGMSTSELGRFTGKLKELAVHHKIKPEDLSSRLLKELRILDKVLGLESLIKEKEAQLHKVNDEMAGVQAEVDGAHSYLKQLMSERIKLEAQISHYRRQLAQDIIKLSDASKESMQKINKSLESGIEVSLSVVHKLTDEAVRVGKEVGELEANIESLGWVKPLISLEKGENGLNNYQVRITSLKVLRSISYWLDQNHSNDLYLLKISVNNAIGELEKWKTSTT